MSTHKNIWIAGVSSALLTGASVASADDAVGAQALFDQAKNAMAARNYADACPKFEESLRLQPALGTLLNLADCYEREGKLATAWSSFLELAAKAAASGQAERAKIGKKRAAALAPRLSNLVIVVTEAAPGIEVKRDGIVAGQAEWGTPIPADPGTHTVEAAAPGKLPWSTSLNVSEGAKTSTVTVPPLLDVPVATKSPASVRGPNGRSLAGGGSVSANTPEPSQGIGTQKVLAIVSAGIGLAGVGVGTYFGLRSMSFHNDAFPNCPLKTCPATPEGRTGYNQWGDARTTGDLATIAFVVGGVGLAGATALWFTASKSESASGSASVARLGLGLGTIQLEETW